MIASYIALAAVTAFLARQTWGRFRNSAATPTAPDRIRSGVYSFLAGMLFANSIPHSIHGISGEYFPAPFGQSLGRGAATDVVNVLWGLFNLGVGYKLVRTFRDMPSR